MAQETGISLRDTLNSLFRRIYILVILVILLPLATLLATYWVSPIYETGGKLLVTGKEQSTSMVRVPAQTGFSSYVNLNVEESDLNSEMELFLSLDLWLQMVKKLGLSYFEQEPGWTPFHWVQGAMESVTELLGLSESPQAKSKAQEPEKIQEKALAVRKLCKVEPTPKSRVLDVNFRYNDPAKAQHILSTLMDLYIPYRTKVYSVHGAHGFFVKEVDSQRSAYENALADLIDFKKQWEIFIPDKQIEEQIGFVRSIEDSIIKLDGDIMQFTNMLTELDRNVMVTGQLASFQNPVISVIAAQLLRASERNIQIKQNFDSGSRDLGESDALVKDLTNGFRETLRGELNGMLAKRQIFEASRIEKALRLSQIEEKTQEAGKLELAAAVAKERYLRYMGKVEDVRIDELLEGGQLQNVRVVSRPFLPMVPVFPKRALMVLGAFVLAFPLGIGLIMVASLFDRTFSAPNEVEAATGYEVLASIKKFTDISSRRPAR